MGDVIRLKLGQLASRFKADQKKLDRRVKLGLARSAKDGAHTVAANAPIAFGPLRESVHADVTRWLAGYSKVSVDSPHAAAVEVGSRPHMPPLEPIIAWVRLRGLQGLRQGKLPGVTSRAHADSVASQLRSMIKYSSSDQKAFARAGRSAERRALKSGASDFEAYDAGQAARAKKIDRRVKAGLIFGADDAITQIARAIQASIAKHGTKPTWFVRGSLPAIREQVDTNMREAVHGSEG